MNVKRFAVAILALGLLCALGCAKEKGYKKVVGTVTMGGQPVDGANLMFYPQTPGGESGGGKTAADGTFTITSSGSQKGATGLLPGEYKVTVMKYDEIDDPDQKAFDSGEIDYDELQKRKARSGAYVKAGDVKLLTPQKFVSMTDTPLVVTVSDDPKQNVFEFNLDE